MVWKTHPDRRSSKAVFIRANFINSLWLYRSKHFVGRSAIAGFRRVKRWHFHCGLWLTYKGAFVSMPPATTTEALPARMASNLAPPRFHARSHTATYGAAMADLWHAAAQERLACRRCRKCCRIKRGHRPPEIGSGYVGSNQRGLHSHRALGTRHRQKRR
jgi:hypothetical protein